MCAPAPAQVERLALRLHAHDYEAGRTCDNNRIGGHAVNASRRSARPIVINS